MALLHGFLHGFLHYQFAMKSKGSNKHSIHMQTFD